MTTNTKHSAPAHSAIGFKKQATATDQNAPRKSSPTEAATRPATINLRNGKLTVDAYNSDLTQILQDLADISGMTITGLTKGPRVFGVYGPGNSREVLRDLLFGSGYNFMMVGGATDGPPRELVLTSRDNNTHALTQHNPSAVTVDDIEESEGPEVKLDTSVPVALDPSLPNALGPGAIVPAPSLDSEDDNTRVQRTLERLQHMQDQQQKNAPQ